MSSAPAVVGVVMGSSSDWETLRAATEILAEFGIPHEARVVSAHRMPDEMFAYAEGAAARGLKAIIAGGPAEKRVGLKPGGRQPVRTGTVLFDEAGKPAGRVTSGGFGPSVQHPVAIGYVSTLLAKPGARFFAEVRGSRIPLEIHPLPFTPHRYRKG